MRRLALVSATLLTVTLVACSSPRTASDPGTYLPAARQRAAHPFSYGSYGNPIQHVVIIMQENRSFDNIFAGYPGADAPVSGPLHTGKIVPLKTINFDTSDLDHLYGASIQDYDHGKMDGFDLNCCDKKGRAIGRNAYARLNRNLVAPYWTMAQEYTLADAMFPTEHGASWTAHLDIISGTTNLSPTTALVDIPSHYPLDCAAPAGTVTSTINSSYQYQSNGPFPCLTQFSTMADTLDAAGLSWRFYAPAVKGDLGGYWSPFGAIRNVRKGPDWANVISPPATILGDIANGTLANVTWVTPEWQYSDHAGGGATMGPSWVASVVNGIGNSQFWNSTAIVVLWDEWGGWYDDAVPPQLDYKGLGIRVPCLIISPYARPGYVSHTQYEFASVLAFVEQTFNLPQLGPVSAGYTDGRATSIIDSFNFAQTPLTFQTIPAPYPPSSFIRMRPSGKAPDDE